MWVQVFHYMTSALGMDHDNQNSRICCELFFQSPQFHWATHPVHFIGRKERQNSIPCHGLQIKPRCRARWRSLCTLRKSTYTDQYLNFHSNHHLQLKRAVVNTLLPWPQTLVSEDDGRENEIQYVKQTLKAINCPTPNTERSFGMLRKSIKITWSHLSTSLSILKDRN